MARQFLKVNDAVFASRPTFAAYKHINYNYSDVSFSPYGPYWREARKIYITKVLNAKKLESFEKIRVEQRRCFLARLQSLSGKPVVLRDYLSRYTLSITCRMIFKGKYFTELEDDKSVVDMDELVEIVEEWFLLNELSISEIGYRGSTPLICKGM
ncbi:hypothetical protein C2S51_036987 [Perilla frutescens var. frutescens]|nr:hypothetical protein C2S51_036987 [Perilla frutescens var. frutescens]